MSCTSAAGCPFITDLDDDYLLIGATTTPEHAALHGGNVGDGETAVLVPKRVIDDAVAGPLLARITELEADLAEARDGRWERDDVSYDVLAEDTVYDEATSLGDAVHKAARAIDDIEEGELADCTIYIRRTTREIRVAQP